MSLGYFPQLQKYRVIHFKYRRSQSVTFNTSVYTQNTIERDVHHQDKGGHLERVL